MYKLLLCWRYLRTRYIALASIISVTLGVATMIVVNSVMTGFTREMQGRIHGILSDLVFESHSMEGFHDPELHMRKIREVAGEYIAGMTPTVVVPAMLVFEVHGQSVPRQVSFIGIDEATHDQVSDFGRYLQHPRNREHLSFDLREDGYDTLDHQAGSDAIRRERMEYAGWTYRRIKAKHRAEMQAQLPVPATPSGGAANPFNDPEVAGPEQIFDAASKQHTGIVVGFAMASYRMHDGSDRFLVLPGDDVKATVPSAGMPPKAISGDFTIVDFYESKMSEYDSNFVFVPIRELQDMRGMIDPQTGIGNVTAIQIKLHDDANGKLVRDKLRAAFPPDV